MKNEIGSTNVELINDRKEKAPSKRIIVAIPEHEGQKDTVGPIVAQDIGLEKLKKSCIHFNEWITKLEKLNVPIDNGFQV